MRVHSRKFTFWAFTLQGKLWIFEKLGGKLEVVFPCALPCGPNKETDRTVESLLCWVYSLHKDEEEGVFDLDQVGKVNDARLEEGRGEKG